jgi:probable rRNA maturation factor
MPEISLLNRQRAHRIDLDLLSQFASQALPQVEAVGRNVMPAEINVVFVSDRRIASIHRRFMQIGTPTDVITFQHGEIVISVETAYRHADRLGQEVSKELCLYLLHGLLHLAGYDDAAVESRREMSRVQRRLLRKTAKGRSSETAKRRKGETAKRRVSRRGETA